MERRFIDRLAGQAQRMPLLRERGGGEGMRIVEGLLEHFLEPRRCLRRVEDQRVVGLDVQSAEAEVRRAEEHLLRLAAAFGDEHLVVLQVEEMHPPDVSGSRRGRQPLAGLGLRRIVSPMVLGIVDDRAQARADLFQERDDVRLVQVVGEEI